MLEGMWRKGNTHALLVGLLTDTVTAENSVKIPLKIRHKSTMWPSNHTSEHKSWEYHNFKDPVIKHHMSGQSLSPGGEIETQNYNRSF